MENTPVQWFKIITERKGDYRKLWKRMSTDYKLRVGEKYTIQDEGGKPIPKAISVTLNDAQNFSDKTIGALNKAVRHIVVEGKGLEDDKRENIERGCVAFLARGNERITSRGTPGGLLNYQNEHICVYGRIATRLILEKDEEGNYYVDLVPFDMKSACYDCDNNGMAWIARWLTKRKARIESEYGITYRGQAGEVTELWTPETNLIWIGNQLIETNPKTKQPVGGPHDYGEVPVVLQIAPVGSTITKDDTDEHSGESIFWLNRLLYPELNRCASIEQSQNILSIRPPFNWESDMGEQGELPGEYPFQSGKGSSAEKGGGAKIPQLPDMINASRHVYAMIYQRIQQGGFTTLDYGNLTFPLSSVAITKLTDDKDYVYVPRLQALATSNQQLFYMFRRFLDKMGIEIDLGSFTSPKVYKSSDFEGNYEIMFKYMAVSPEQNIANASVASALRGLIPDEDISRDVLLRDNPTRDRRKLLIEAAERESKVLRVIAQAKALAKEGRGLEAELFLRESLGIGVEELQGSGSGNGDNVNIPEPTPRPIIPLMGSGAESGMRKSESDKLSAPVKAAFE